MEQQEAFMELAHHSYHDESLSKFKVSPKLPSSMHQLCKREEQDYHIHATPSTQNPVIEDSVILQETLKKKCIGCVETERKVYEIEHELRSERKKNLRYLKIINNKMMKEKELQTAYSQIAQELKKKMDAASARELSMQSLVRSYQRQAEQLRNSYQQVVQLGKKLTEANASLKRADQRYEQLLKARQQMKVIDQSSNGPSELQIMNVFYEKQVVELHQKINTLESQMKLQEEQLKYQKNIAHRRQMADLAKEDGAKYSNEMPQLVNHERTSNKSKVSDEKGNSFRSSNIVIEEMEGFKPFNMSKISSIDARKDQSQLKDIIELNKEESFNTVREWRASQFHSIYHSQILNAHSRLLSFLNSKHSDADQEADINQSQYFTINSLLSHKSNKSQQPILQVKQLQKIIQKDVSLQYPSISYQVSKQVKREEQLNQKAFEVKKNERDAVLRFVQTVRNLLGKVETSFRDAGKSHKLILQLPQVPKFSQSASKDGFNEIIEDLMQCSKVVEEAAQKIEQHFQEIVKMTKKSYERALNDQQLQLAELKSIISREDNEKQHLGKIVEKLQEHNTRLEYKISESEEASVSKSYIRDTYIRSVLKKKSSLFINRFKEEFIQCQIIASNVEEVRLIEIRNYKNVVNALTYLPKFINQILKKRQIDGGLWIDMGKDLQPQLEDIIKRTLTLLQIQIPNYPQNTLKKLRRASFSTKMISNNEDKSKQYQNMQLITENAHLRDTLKEQTEKVITLNEKNNFLSSQKARLEKQIKQVQNKLEQDIMTLRLQLTQSKAEIQKGGRRIARNGEMIDELNSQSGEFEAFEEKIEFNNLYCDKEQQLKTLKQKNEIYERELARYKKQARRIKKKVIYINN